MITAFAVNQVMGAVHGTPSTIYTDAVPLNGNDRAFAVLDVQYIFGGGTSRQIACTPQVSNDGLNWLDAAAAFTASAAGVDDAGPYPLYASQFRMKFAFTVVGSAGEQGMVSFSLTVSFSKA